MNKFPYDIIPRYLLSNVSMINRFRYLVYAHFGYQEGENLGTAEVSPLIKGLRQGNENSISTSFWGTVLNEYYVFHQYNFRAFKLPCFCNGYTYESSS